MAMKHKGLAKLIEECGEVQQVAGKMLAYPKGKHPDGSELHARLAEELADCYAAIHFVRTKYDFDRTRFLQRVRRKLARYKAWDNGKKHKA